MLIYFSSEYYFSILYVCNSILIPFYLVLQAPETKFHLHKWISEQYIKNLIWRWHRGNTLSYKQNKQFNYVHNSFFTTTATGGFLLSAIPRTVPHLPLPPSGHALCFPPRLPFTGHSNFHKCRCIFPTKKWFLNDSFKKRKHSPYISYESFLMIMLYNKNPFCLYQKWLFILLNRLYCYLIVSINKFR